MSEVFESEQTSLLELALDTGIPNLRLLSGASAILEAANPDFETRRRFVRALKSMPVDVILVDLGAGAHYPALDFFAIADYRIVVTSPEPTSIQNAYSLLKRPLIGGLN